MSIFSRMRPRGTRAEIPAAAPGSNIYGGGGQWGQIDLPLPSSTAVFGMPAASRARSLIANAVAQMSPLDMWTPDGFLTEGKTPNICTRPNTVFGCFDFFEMVVSQTITHGNFVGLLADFDSTGFAQQIVPVPEGMYLAYYDGAGYLVYSIMGELYSRDEVVHVRINSSPNQPMGVGVVRQFRRSLGQALDQQNFAADTYRSGSVPSGVIQLDLPEIDVAQANAVQSQWLVNHSSGSRAPAVLPKSMTFTPIAWTPEDLQFLQSRQFTVAEIAHMFNLDPSDLGATLAGSSMTYANIEQRQQQRIVDTYAPWMRRIEEEWTDLVPGANVAKMNPTNLLRSDSKTAAEVDQLSIANETLTVDEARHKYGRQPLPKPKPPVAPVVTPGAPLAPGVAAKPGDPAVAVPGAPAVDPATGGIAPDAAAGDPNMVVKPVSVKI